MICIKRTINSEQLYFDYEVNGSVTACNATLGKKNTLILCCYFPPENSKYAYNEDHLQSFFRNIGILQKKFNEVMIYGDFNFPTINWKSLSSSIHLENKFLEHLESHALQQKVNFHTASSGILDLFLVSDNVQVVNVVSIEDSNISKLSNHYPFEVQFSVKISDLLLRSCVTQQIYSFCSENYGELSKYITENNIFSYCWSNPNKILELWYEWLDCALEVYIPKRTMHRSSLPPWISKETSHLIKCLKTARKRYGETHTKVKDLAYQVEIKATNDKITYEQNMAGERSTTMLFKYFRAFRKENLPKKMNYEKASADDDLSKANLFATYFASVYTHSTTFHQTSENSDVKVISDNLFSEKEVMTICKDLKINKSKGPDGLPPLLFKKICLSIPHSLCQLYRKILQTGIFPDLWKQAVVIPIFKKSSKSDVTNYRPVSLLSIPSKIFEHILFKKIYEHCAEYLHVSQYGFRKNRSPIIQLITFLQKVYNGFESQQDIDILLTDFSKAFDRVDHGILLQKLHDIVVRGNLFEVLKSYLYGRSQRVRIANELSKEISVTSGVPQGSILSPLLFLIFINDLPEKCEHIIPLLFADDAKFLSVGFSQNLAQKDLDVLLKWTKLNKLPFNMDKCNHMEIGKSQKQLKFGDELIQMVSVQSDLGLTISNNLKWNLHIDKACSKAIRVFHMIKRNVSNLNTEAKLNLYKSMVVPVILYGSPCYGMSKYVMSEL